MDLPMGHFKPHTEEAKRKISLKTTKKFEDLKHFPTIRNKLFKERGRKCQRCGWAEENPFNGFIPVQVDHIDGNRKNNSKDNLIILCPNCHSLTKYFMNYGRKRN